jgi:CRP/FNR family transcriptional regulator
MNRSDIGDYLSLATETVSRVFVQFQENGWITIAGKQISINQREALLELSAP